MFRWKNYHHREKSDDATYIDVEEVEIGVVVVVIVVLIGGAASSVCAVAATSDVTALTAAQLFSKILFLFLIFELFITE